MYSQGKEKAKVGIVSVDIKGKSYRLRFTYPEYNRHEFTIAQVSDEGWITAIKAVQMINRDLDLGDFDDTYARYSPRHARKIAIAQQKRNKEYNLKELWEMYKESNKDRVAKTTQARNWTQFDRFLKKVDSSLLDLKNLEAEIVLAKNNVKRSSILLQFKIPGKSRSKYGCNCSFTLDGMVSALSKARKVAEALKSLESESEFWEWYDREIKKIGKIENDLLTFRDAIAAVEDDYWKRRDRRKRKRIKGHPSDEATYTQILHQSYL